MSELTLPMSLGPAPTFTTSGDGPHWDDFADTQPAPPHTLSIAFTGSGSEYLRIWIVNLLLTLVTLGIYYPWAKVRRLRYFHGNTLVGGEPLGFHGDPKKMLKGYLLVSVLLALYSGAGHFHAVAGLVAFIVVMLIWPALLKSSMQFRLANTSWRGLRFRFTGDVQGAYAAMIPLFIPALCFVGSLAFVPDQEHPPRWYFIVTGIVSFATALTFPWLFKRLKAYQHNHYSLASQDAAFAATTGMFYKLSLKIAALYIVGMGGIGFLAAATVSQRVQPDAPGDAASSEWGPYLMLGIFLLAMLAFVAILKPYFTARMQNLVWGHTHSQDVQLLSRLKARSMVWLSIKNWVLVVLTLGLYWPFAAIARARMQLEAMGISTHMSLDALVSDAQDHEGEAAGDAAGDLFGLDIGF